MLAELRARGLKLGLVSNTGRDLDEFVAHHGLDVDAALGSGAPRQDEAAPDDLPGGARRIGVEPAEAAMVGDSPEDDIEGARALGMRSRSCSTATGATRSSETGLPDLLALPAALGLEPANRR